MEANIKHQLKVKKVREMKNPTILMNEKDFENFKKEVESKINDFKVGDNPSYEGVPILTACHIEQGNILIYDCVVSTYCNTKPNSL